MELVHQLALWVMPWEADIHLLQLDIGGGWLTTVSSPSPFFFFFFLDLMPCHGQIEWRLTVIYPSCRYRIC